MVVRRCACPSPPQRWVASRPSSSSPRSPEPRTVRSAKLEISADPRPARRSAAATASGVNRRLLTPTALDRPLRRGAWLREAGGQARLPCLPGRAADRKTQGWLWAVRMLPPPRPPFTRAPVTIAPRPQRQLSPALEKRPLLLRRSGPPRVVCLACLPPITPLCAARPRPTDKNAPPPRPAGRTAAS
jgi:hypothetical protein